MIEFKIKTGNETSSHLVKCEIVYDGITYYSTKMEGEIYTDWTGGNTTFESQNFLKSLNEGGVYLIDKLNESLYDLNCVISFKGLAIDPNEEVFSSYDEEDIIRFKSENQNIDYSWFTGEGLYYQNQNVFNNGGIVLVFFKD